MEYCTITDHHAVLLAKAHTHTQCSKALLPREVWTGQAEGHSDGWDGWKPCACPRAWSPPLPRFPARSVLLGASAGRQGKDLKVCSMQPGAAWGNGVGGGSSRVHGGPQAAFPWEAGCCVWTGVGRWSCPLLPQPSPISKEHPWSWRCAVPTPLDGLPSPQLSSERLGL